MNLLLRIHLFFRKDSQPSFIVKALLGMAAGCVGAFVGTPAEVALIRMTADGRLPIGKLLLLFLPCDRIITLLVPV